MAAFSSSTSLSGMEVTGLRTRKSLLGLPAHEISVQRLEMISGQKAILDQNCSERRRKRTTCLKLSVRAQASVLMGRAHRWWDKHLVPNMVEISSAPELIDAISNAGDKLVVVDFFSPGCGGCKALHPKICKIADANPEVQFFTLNYEKLKPLCHSLHIHVLPFFRFYRGAEGRLCSFSCTVATINKFKNALVKHGSDRCSLGPTRGLEESELISLVGNRVLPLDFLSNPASRSRYELDMPCSNSNSEMEQVEASVV